MIIIRWIVSAIAIGITAYLIPGVSVTPVAALVLVIVLAIINALIRPLIALVALPLTIITLGLFSFVINALLILLAARIVTGFTVSSFVSALLFAIVLSLVNAVFHSFEGKS
jgi:putative membrane protein